MIGDTFKINDKSYTIKKELKLGEYRKISKINSRLSILSKSISDNMSNEKTADFSEASNDQLQVICDFLESHLGLNENDIDNLGMTESITVFQKAFELSTTVEKELKKTSD